MRNQGALTVSVRCYEGETDLAYVPIVAALRAAIAQKGGVHWQKRIASHWLSEATRLLPELATSTQPPSPPNSPGAQSHFFEGLIQVLLSLCSEEHRPAGILFFDDLQWADSTSLDLLSYLARRLHDHHVCLLLAWRNTQENAIPRLHHLHREAQRSGNAAILSLARLSLPAVKELMQGITAGNLKSQTGLIERLYSETEGLPFFLIEYLNALTKGVLTPEEVCWSLPGGVRDLLKSRIADVGGTGEQLLSAAASIGRSFDFDTLREVSGRSEEETVTALEELIEQGLVEEMQDSRLSIASTETDAHMNDINHEK